MKTVVTFTNNKVQILCGEGASENISVTKIIEVQFDMNCVMNGVITDTETFCAGMKKAFTENTLPKSGVILSLDGNNIKSKKVVIPKVNSEKTQEIVAREFQEIEVLENPIFGFITMAKGEKTQEIIAIGTEFEFIKNLVQAFKAIGIKIGMITSTRCAMIRLTDYLDFIAHKNCIIQTLDGETLTSILIENGAFMNISNSRVFSEHGTTSFGTEVARSISQLLQFQSSQRSTNVVTEVFLGGFSPEDFSAAKGQIELLSLGVRPFENGTMLHLPENMSGRVFVHVGAFAIGKTEGNIYSAYQTKKKNIDGRDKVLMQLLPILTVIAVFALVGSSMVIGNLAKEQKVRELSEYVTNPENIEKEKTYMELIDEAAALNGKLRATEEAQKAIDSYPLMTSALSRVIADCGNGIVDVNILSYSSATGNLNFTAAGKSADKINEFIRALTDTGVFYGVSYSGYTLNADTTENNYSVNVSCTLSPAAGR